MVDEDDKMEIEYLFFEKMMELEEIEKHFKGKYTYREIKSVTRKRIGDYNGITIETAKQTISRNKN